MPRPAPRGLLGVVLSGLVIVVCVALVFAAGETHSVQQRGPVRVPPSEGDAHAALYDRYFAASKAPDAAAYCADAAHRAMCLRSYETAGGKAGVPREPPTVRRSEVRGLERVVFACGVNGAGEPYDTEFVVGLRDRRPVWVLDVFWLPDDPGSTPTTCAPGP